MQEGCDRKHIIRTGNKCSADSNWQRSALMLQVRDEMAAVLDRITLADPIALGVAAE
jgi:DNA-binding IscR family transcriptional regulator